MEKNIGLLMPKSVLYPSMSFDLIAGLKNGLEAAGIKDVTIKTESIVVAGDNKLIYSACEKLLFDGCTVVAGYVNPASAEKLAPLFESANALFIALDAGYHFPTTVEKKDNVFYISLQGTLCCRVTARVAMADGNKSFAYSSSFLDAGYRSLHSFAEVVNENGGSFTFNHITKLKRSEFTIEPLQEHLNTAKTDAVLTSFSGDMMQDFFAGASANNVFEQHPVYGSPFMADEQWLAQSVYPGTNIKTCVTWSNKLDTPGNELFRSTMLAKKQRTNLFSMLGWEISYLLPIIFEAEDSAAANKALEGLKYNGPRGAVTIDAATHHCYAPVYEGWIRKNETDGTCILEILKESPYTEEERKKHEIDINNFSGHATSWHNAYACLES